jgi:hypothetical protein
MSPRLPRAAHGTPRSSALLIPGSVILPVSATTVPLVPGSLTAR